MPDKMSSKSVEAAETLLQDIKAKAKQANDTEDTFMMGIMTEVLGVVSPIVTRAIARYHREERAVINKAHKELRKKTRGQPASNSEK
jgi:hypothetical protein